MAPNDKRAFVRGPGGDDRAFHKFFAGIAFGVVLIGILALLFLLF